MFSFPLSPYTYPSWPLRIKFSFFTGCEGPTYAPTLSPSNNPSYIPTPSPSNKPSNIHTSSPSYAPTLSPSNNPSHIPTPSPSYEPSNIHSYMPSQTCMDKDGEIKFGRYKRRDGTWGSDYGDRTCKWLHKSADHKKSFFCQKKRIRSFCYGTCSGLLL